jgi:ribonuclease P protein component
VVVHLVQPEEASNPARSRTARAGFVVSKAVGDAVIRNRVKRRLRHLVRDHFDEIPAGCDLVVRALPTAASRPYRQIEVDLVDAIRAASRRRDV